MSSLTSPVGLFLLTSKGMPVPFNQLKAFVLAAMTLLSKEAKDVGMS